MQFNIKLLENEANKNVTYLSDNTIMVGSSCKTGICSPYELILTPGMYRFSLYGASGTTKLNDYSLGGFSSGSLFVPKRKTVYLYIGECGTFNGSATFNGGGKGNIYGWSGGGATDVRLLKGNIDEFESLKSRIIVAGGGGGYVESTRETRQYGDKCEGGGLEGGNGFFLVNPEDDILITKSLGATQERGGIAGTGPDTTTHPVTDGMNGTFGIGGETVYGSGGGGGGYFGGGSGKTNPNNIGSGSGGSSYISGYNGCKSITEDSQKDNITMIDSPYHYSGMKFMFPEMKRGVNFGNGYMIIRWSAFHHLCTLNDCQSKISNIFVYILFLHTDINK